MTIKDEMLNGWTRDNGDVVQAKMYADDTMTISLHPDGGHDYSHAICLTLDTWRAIYHDSADTDEFTIEESDNETVTVTVTEDEQVLVESSYVTDTIELTRDELDNALSHARSARKSLEYEGLI